EKAQVMANYAPSISNSESDRQTKTLDGNGEYTVIATDLSNKFNNTYNTQRGGLSYRYNDQKVMVNLGANYQQAILDGQSEFPQVYSVNKTFSNILPSAMINYKFSRTQNLRFMYRTNTNAPSISQLQNVPDITDPLLVRTGNPELSQDYTHTLMLRYGNTNTAKSTNFFAMAFASFVQDYIANASFIVREPTPIAEGFVLPAGGQISRPVNLDGYWSARTFLTYGLPVKTIKSNVNMNLGFNYNSIPGIINDIKNMANNYTVNGGIVLSSNISEAVDFTLSYSGYYNVVRNTIQTQADNNYYNHNTSARFNWLHKQRVVFNTTLNHTQYSGLSAGFNQSFLLWNASVGYKFLTDRSLDIRVSAYDILNQNRAISRTVTETYIEDSYTNVLRQYFMLNLTYTLRRFGGAGAPAANDNSRDEVMPVSPGGGRRRQ
ncbi:MAG: TonB-dependent receptor, partial [Sphingobacteriales bacterium]